MTFYYCPRCKKKTFSDSELPRDKVVVINLRDGWGRPIKHYECECGYKNAGSMNTNSWIVDDYTTEYMKYVIGLYDKED